MSQDQRSGRGQGPGTGAAQRMAQIARYALVRVGQFSVCGGAGYLDMPPTGWIEALYVAGRAALDLARIELRINGQEVLRLDGFDDTDEDGAARYVSAGQLAQLVDTLQGCPVLPNIVPLRLCAPLRCDGSDFVRLSVEHVSSAAAIDGLQVFAALARRL